jgi:PAS domain S-box-containing protein
MTQEGKEKPSLPEVPSSGRADCLLDIRQVILSEIIQEDQQEVDRLRLVLSEMPEGVIITDTKNRIQWINRKACELLEVEESEAIGESIKAFHNESFIKDTRNFFDTMSSSRMEFIEFEGVVKGRDINFRISPLQSKDQFIGILRVLRDVTASRKTQEQIRLLAQAVNAVVEAIYIVDHNMVIQYVNPAFTAITGYDKRECIGRTPDMLNSGQHEEGFYEERQRTLAEGRSWSGRVICSRKNGSLYTADCTISPVFGDEGETCYFVAVQKDITHELEIESQLLRSQKMEFIGRLTGGIAHDFNNMLTAIIGNAHLISAEMDENDPFRPEVESILKASLSAAGFVRQLLTFSRRQRGEVRPVNLNYILGEMEPLLRRMIGENIKVSIRKEGGLKNNMGDQGQVEQILANLCLNARDAMPDGGNLFIETSNLALTEETARLFSEVTPGEYTQMTVSDSGIGIDEENRDKVFEPFFTTKEKGKGTGLGLSIVYGIVKQYGGDIKISSSRGQGTTFTIIFPAVEKVMQTAAAQEMVEIRGGSETILLVEDEDVVCNFAEKAMKKLGYRVLVARNGADAKSIFEREKDGIDLIFTDQILPDITGTRLVNDLLGSPGSRENTGVIYVSGYPDFQAISSMVLSSGALLLEKPFTPEALAHKLRQALDEKKNAGQD